MWRRPLLLAALASALCAPAWGKVSVSINWQAGIEYAPGQRVWVNGEWYEAPRHIHSPRFDPQEWRVVPREARVQFRWQGDWRDGRGYAVGDRVYRDGMVWEAVSAHRVRVHGEWNAGFWRPLPQEDWNRWNGGGYPQRGYDDGQWRGNGHGNGRGQGHRKGHGHGHDHDYDPGDAGAGGWREGMSYRRGDLVAFRGGMYRCVQSHRAERGASWFPDSVPALWERVR